MKYLLLFLLLASGIAFADNTTNQSIGGNMFYGPNWLLVFYNQTCQDLWMEQAAPNPDTPEFVEILRSFECREGNVLLYPFPGFNSSYPILNQTNQSAPEIIREFDPDTNTWHFTVKLADPIMFEPTVFTPEVYATFPISIVEEFFSQIETLKKETQDKDSELVQCLTERQDFKGKYESYETSDSRRDDLITAQNQTIKSLQFHLDNAENKILNVSSELSKAKLSGIDEGFSKGYTTGVNKGREQNKTMYFLSKVILAILVMSLAFGLIWYTVYTKGGG